jgi:hypothetical protein
LPERFCASPFLLGTLTIETAPGPTGVWCWSWYYNISLLAIGHVTRLDFEKEELILRRRERREW